MHDETLAYIRARLHLQEILLEDIYQTVFARLTTEEVTSHIARLRDRIASGTNLPPAPDPYTRRLTIQTAHDAAYLAERFFENVRKS